METKICSKCKIEKSINEFCNNKKKKDNKNIWCKECQKVMPADWTIGRQAGILRNINMLEYVKPNGILIAFCKNNSPGTTQIIGASDYHKIEKFVFDIS